jgi:hypothetical protein
VLANRQHKLFFLRVGGVFRTGLISPFGRADPEPGNLLSCCVQRKQSYQMPKTECQPFAAVLAYFSAGE